MTSRCASTGKMRYANKAWAERVKRRMANCMLNVFKCPSCGDWHLGRSRSLFRLQQRFDEILARDKSRETKT